MQVNKNIQNKWLFGKLHNIDAFVEWNVCFPNWLLIIEMVDHFICEEHVLKLRTKRVS